MSREIRRRGGRAADIVTAACQIIDPRSGLTPFPGTFDEAIDAMVAYADLRWDQARLTESLRNSDPDRVAEICAGALLRLAGQEAHSHHDRRAADVERDDD